MEKIDIIRSISERTGGDIYLGVVGAVRTGKSTFIKKFIETMVLPNIEDENSPRMVRTPWYDEEIPFIEAAEIGTEKVIRDHSTIGIVVTTDGSIGEIGRKNYEEKENKVIQELKEIGKPFIVLLNSTHPMLRETERLANQIKETHNVPVLAISAEAMSEKDSYNILKEALYEFPVLDVKVNMPEWIGCLKPTHWLKKIYIKKIKESVVEVDKLRDIEGITSHFNDCEYIEKSYLSNVDPSTGEVTINLHAKEELYNIVLKEIINIDVRNRAEILSLFQDMSEAKGEYDQIKSALKMVKQTGYGVAIPTLDDLKLDIPEVLKHGSRYGVKLKAVAPSIHMILTRNMHF